MAFGRGLNMRSGDLRNNFRLESRVEDRDAFGQSNPKSTGFTTEETPIRASLEQLSGRELELARQQFPETTHRIRFHYISDQSIDNTMRMYEIDLDRYFNILSSNNIENRNKVTELLVKEDLTES